MKSKLLFRSGTLVCVAASALSLLSGCKTKETPVAYYSPSSPMGGTDSASDSERGTFTSEQTTEARQSGQSQATNQTIIPLQQETLRVGKREVDAGSVKLRKVVRTETVNQPVQLRRESLTVDRLSADASAQPGQSNLAPQQGGIGTPFQEGEIVLRLKKEEPVAEIQAVPAGQVVARMSVNTDQVNVQKQVRREDIQVTKEGAADNITLSQNLQASSEMEAAGAGPTTGGKATGTASGGQQPITDLSQLTGTSDKSSLAGRQVKLSGAKVQSISTDRTLLSVGNDQNSRVWIRTSSPSQDIKEGDMVRVTGTVQTTAQNQSNLSEEIVQQLKSEPFYIEATAAEKIPQNQ